jgi:cobalamin biosynthesis protein CobC
VDQVKRQAMQMLQRDHGGDVSALRARFGSGASDWLDLSTGINPIPYPVPPISGAAWCRLPQRDAEAILIAAARQAYGVPVTADVVPAAGAQVLIERIPLLRPAGRCAIVSPTYNEHAASFRAAGWTVEEVPAPVGGFDALVVVNPNNPDGRCWSPETLLGLLPTTGLLLVDESFADAAPALSLAPHTADERLVVLRSFGKFFGLAGLRLGFALTGPKFGSQLREQLGLWSVSGPALEIGAAALTDVRWAQETRARLADDAARLDAILTRNGLTVLGGTPLFRLAETPHAAALQIALAERQIAVRGFPYAPYWLRFGLPGAREDWDRLTAGLAQR